jgi:hypothetical protein
MFKAPVGFGEFRVDQQCVHGPALQVEVRGASAKLWMEKVLLQRISNSWFQVRSAAHFLSNRLNCPEPKSCSISHNLQEGTSSSRSKSPSPPGCAASPPGIDANQSSTHVEAAFRSCRIPRKVCTIEQYPSPCGVTHGSWRECGQLQNAKRIRRFLKRLAVFTTGQSS